jgi:uncharacterized protein
VATVIDTGPIVANANRTDAWHDRCRHLFENLPGPLFVPVPVVPEVCYLLSARAQPSAEGAFLDAAVVATAERLDVTEIATLDRAHFSAVRPRHVAGFTLVP